LLSSIRNNESPFTTFAWPSTVAANEWNEYTKSKSILSFGMEREDDPSSSSSR
jgi:hypothetical protein